MFIKKVESTEQISSIKAENEILSPYPPINEKFFQENTKEKQNRSQ